MKNIYTTFVMFLLLVLVSNAQNILSYVGDATSNVQLKTVLMLSDSSFLIAGRANNINWLPGVVTITTLDLSTTTIVSDWSDATHLANTIQSYGVTQIAFIMRVSKNYSTILDFVRFPANTVVDITKIKTNSKPGDPIDDIYISGERLGDATPASDGYYIAKLNENFISGVPTSLTWFRNVYIRTAGDANKYNQPWDVDADGEIVFVTGETLNFNWGEIFHMDTTGALDYVPEWPFQYYTMNGGVKYPQLTTRLAGGLDIPAFIKVGKFTITIGSTDISNCSNADGAVNITVGNDTVGYTDYAAVAPVIYQWTGPNGFTAATEDLTALNTPGVYKVTITDANNAKAYAETTVNHTSALNLATAVTNIATCGGTSGAINLTISGGSGAYTWLWTKPGNIPVSSEDLSGLDVGGAYTVTVVDMISGCFKAATATVANPAAGFYMDKIDVTDVNSHLVEFPGGGDMRPSLKNQVNPVTCFWIYPDGTLDTSSTLDSKDLVLLKKIGWYTLVAIDGNNCKYGLSKLLSIDLNVKDTISALTLTGAYSSIRAKGSMSGNLRSNNVADFNYIGSDANGNAGRKGKSPMDGLQGAPCINWDCSINGAGSIGFTAPYRVDGYYDIAINRNNGDVYMGQTIRDRNFSNVIALKKDGSVKWWDRMAYFGEPSNTKLFNPYNRIDQLEIDYLNNKLVVLARTRFKAKAPYVNLWKGDDLFYNPTAYGFQNNFTGDSAINLNKEISWIGRYNLSDGHVMNTTFIGEPIDGTTTGMSVHADANLDGWFNLNTGNPSLEAVVATSMNIDQATGNIYIAATGNTTVNGTRFMTTAYAQQKMDKQTEGFSCAASLVRVYKADLSMVIYSSLIAGQWEPATTGINNGANNTKITAVLPVKNGLLAVGNKLALVSNDIPVVNIPSWGSATASNIANGIFAEFGFDPAAITITSAPSQVARVTDYSVNFSLPSTVTYDTSNIFTLQLSSNKLSFATTVAIGSLKSVTAGSITMKIPALTAIGIYRIRVVSSKPQTLGEWKTITIATANLITSVASGSATIVPAGTSAQDIGKTIIITATPAANNVIQKWTINGVDYVKDTNNVSITIRPQGDTVSVTLFDYTWVKNSDVDVSVATYPNPATDLLNIRLGKDIEGIVRLKLTNMIGYSLLSKSVQKAFSADVVSLDVTSLPAGVYILEIITSSGITTQRITKK